MARLVTFDFVAREGILGAGIVLDADIAVDVKQKNGTLIETLTLTTGSVFITIAAGNVYQVVNYALADALDDYIIVEWKAKKNTVNVEPFPYIERVMIPELAVGGATCEVFGAVLGSDGQPLVNAVVRFLPQPTPQKTTSGDSNAVLLTTDTIEVLTDAQGVFRQKLVRLSTMRVSIPRANVTAAITIPDQASVNLATLVLP